MKKISKAIAAACGSLAGAITLAAADGAITGWEVAGILGTVLAATTATWAAPANDDRSAARRRQHRRSDRVVG